MNEQIKKLHDLRSKAQELVEAYSNGIKALQLICDHKWRYTGHSHNDSHYECDECGAEKWE